jgi:hypothetical protein
MHEFAQSINGGLLNRIVNTGSHTTYGSMTFEVQQLSLFSLLKKHFV